MAIILYDTVNNVPGKAMSPFANKIRMILNYKGIEHKTVFFKPTKVHEGLKALGVPPNDLELLTGKSGYTIPVLHDSEKGIFVTDSLRISKYLDDAYPDTPRVFPLDSAVALLAFDNAFYKDIIPSLLASAGPKIFSQLDENLAAIYRGMLERFVGTSFEEHVANPSRMEPFWKGVKDGFAGLDVYFRKVEIIRGQENVVGPFASGGMDPLYADFSLVASLIWAARALGEDSEKWKELRTWNEGRWARLYDGLKPYMTVYE